jgi:hypothetical protein
MELLVSLSRTQHRLNSITLTEFRSLRPRDRLHLISDLLKDVRVPELGHYSRLKTDNDLGIRLEVDASPLDVILRLESKACGYKNDGWVLVQKNVMTKQSKDLVIGYKYDATKLRALLEQLRPPPDPKGRR